MKLLFFYAMATVFCSTSLTVEGAVHEMSTAGLNSLQTCGATQPNDKRRIALRDIHEQRALAMDTHARRLACEKKQRFSN